MGAAENADVVRRGYEAFSARDFEALGALFGEDPVWHVPGRGVLSGTKRGRDAILGYFRELGERSQGSLQVTVRDVVGGESHTVGIHHAQAERKGKTLEQDTAAVFVLRYGKVVECREFFEDTSESDDFWA